MPNLLANTVIELRASDNWEVILKRVAKFLDSGAVAVCILDDKSRKMAVFYPDRLQAILSQDDELALPGDLEGKPRVSISRFFE